MGKMTRPERRSRAVHVGYQRAQHQQKKTEGAEVAKKFYKLLFSKVNTTSTRHGSRSFGGIEKSVVNKDFAEAGISS